jgi:hypothetical protein
MSAYEVSERVALALARDAGLRSSVTITGERDLHVPGQTRRIYTRLLQTGPRIAHKGTPYELEYRSVDAFIPDVMDAVRERLGVTIVIESSSTGA